MSQPMIVGICRFSYLGLGDWQEFRSDKTISESRLDTVAAELYTEERMRARFLSFEHICLPSILAQDDPNFTFLIVSSPRMPAHWRERLEALCNPHDRLQVLWTEVPRLGEALEGNLMAFHEQSEGNLWQFRLDDDDAIDVDFAPRLRRSMRRLEGFKDCAISTARGISVALCNDMPKYYLEYRMPFLGAGLTVKLSSPKRSIFSFGHFAIAKRLTNFLDHESVGALVMKWDSDSRELNLEKLPPPFRKLTPRGFNQHIRRSFPFLRGFDFDRLRPAPQDRSAAPAGISGNTC